MTTFRISADSIPACAVPLSAISRSEFQGRQGGPAIITCPISGSTTEQFVEELKDFCIELSAGPTPAPRN
jgi:hypothetical protein